MKVSMSTLALLASSTSAFALIAPGRGQPEPKSACVKIMLGEEGQMYAGSCDETLNNEKFKKPLLDNGCAEGQAYFSSIQVELPACPDPRIVQL